MTRCVSLLELEQVFADAENIIDSDYAAAMSLLNETSLSIELPDHLRDDPFCVEYTEWVVSEYHQLAKVEEYNPVEQEADRNVPVDLPLRDYFPFNTDDISLIGKYFAGLGLLLKELKGLRGRRVVEYGVGWGHVTSALARAGFDVACVDIEAKFLSLAKRQAAQLGCTVRTHMGAFGERPYDREDEWADAVIFFEAFHHALHHRDVLARIRNTVLRPGGRLILAAEPINPAFPYPWGIRPDGHALWSVRSHGWMELGFQEDYLLECLISEGFLVRKTFVDSLDLFGLLYSSTLHEGEMYPGETLLPSAQAVTWAVSPAGGEPRRWAQDRSRMSLDATTNWSTIEVVAVNHLPITIRADFRLVPDTHTTTLVFQPGESKTFYLELPEGRRSLEVSSETAVPEHLGLNDDTRRLGIAIERIRYHQ